MVTCPKWVYFFPSLIFFILSFISVIDFMNVIETQKIYLLLKKLFIAVVYFLLGFQFFMFGLFRL